MYLFENFSFSLHAKLLPLITHTSPFKPKIKRTALFCTISKAWNFLQGKGSKHQKHASR